MAIENPGKYIRSLGDRTFLEVEPGLWEEEVLLDIPESGRQLFVSRFESTENAPGRDFLVVRLEEWEEVFAIIFPHDPEIPLKIIVGTAPLAGSHGNVSNLSTHIDYVLEPIPGTNYMTWKQGTTFGVSSEYFPEGIFLRKEFNEDQEEKHQAGMLKGKIELPDPNRVDIPATAEAFIDQVSGWLADPQSFADGSLAPHFILKES